MDSAGKAGAGVTALIITKNEARNVTDCLASVGWTDEQIVVDAESTDETAHLAKTLGARVLVRPWAGYGPQKNFGIDQARTEWVLIVDADERVPPELRTEVQATLANGVPPDVAGFELPRRNFFYGRWIRHGGMFPDYQLRLIRRAVCRYDDTRLHERMLFQGRVRRLSQPLDHWTMPSVGHHAKKIAVYSTLGAEEKLRRQGRVTIAQIAGRHLGTIFKTYVMRGAVRDGVHGLIVSVFAGMFTFLKYAKAWESLQAAGPDPMTQGGRRAARH